MSDTQDGHELRKLIRALVVEYSTAYLSHEGAQKIIELCRAHFQRQAEPVVAAYRVIGEGGIPQTDWIDGDTTDPAAWPNCWIQRAFASPPIPADQWQPIETAPKDGTHCWVYETETGKQWRGYFYEGRWVCGAASNDHTVSWMMVITPTHWMPLLAAPKEGA